jgi:hypothetical protein
MDCLLDSVLEFALNLIAEGFVKGVRSGVRDFREQKDDRFTLLRLTTPPYEETPRHNVEVGFRAGS